MGKQVRIRSFVIGGFFTLFFIAITCRLYWVQVVEGKALFMKAENAWSREVVLQPKRGTIMDRNGQVLAQDGVAFTVAVNPRLIHSYKQEELVVHTLAPLLGMDTPEGKRKLRDRVTAVNKDGNLLAQVEIRNEGWKIDKATADQIKEQRDALNLQGVYLIEQSKRYYPAEELASQVLGYVDKENTARSGLELFYDEMLKGKPGKIAYEKDALGYELPDGKASIIKPVDGKDLKLTIDRNIQHYIEEALVKMNEEFKPKAAMVIAADPNTMEILGMSSLPTYNPNHYWDFAEKADFAVNRNISSQYEPGSTFKIVTLAAAVDQGIFHPDDPYKSGSIMVGSTKMGDHNNRQGWGEISYLEGLKRSSNVAFIKLGYEGLGREKLSEYIRNFGFGEKTGIDLPGEIGGNTRIEYATEVAAATFGQGVTVTALQQVAAVSAIANGGNLMKPYLVKEIVDSETGRSIKKIAPETVRRVLSEEKARLVADYLEQVVSDQKIGSGRRVYTDGYRIAGKTGTAQTVIDGKYADGKWVVSFTGFAPVNDPKIVLIVIVDEPDLGGDYRRGSEVTAPVFKEIMSKSLRYLGVPKANTTIGVTQMKEVNAVTMPDLVGKDWKEAGSLLSRYGMSYEKLGIGDKVMKQYPRAGDQITIEQQVYLVSESSDLVNVPDMMGRPMRDVLEVCSLIGADCSYAGEGYVTSQSVNPVSDTLMVSFSFDPYRPDTLPNEEQANEDAMAADQTDSKSD